MKRKRGSTYKNIDEDQAFLSQSTLTLYLGVIAKVQERVEQRLLSAKKSKKEASRISRQLAESWKQELNKLDVLDEKHLAGKDVSLPPVERRSKRKCGPLRVQPIKTNTYVEGKGVPKTLSELYNPFEAPLVTTRQQEIITPDQCQTPLIKNGYIYPEDIKVSNSAKRTEEIESDASLGSGDDSDFEDEIEPKDTMICGYDKIQPSRDTFTLQLKCGVINVEGKDYTFRQSEMVSIPW